MRLVLAIATIVVFGFGLGVIGLLIWQIKNDDYSWWQ